VKPSFFSTPFYSWLLAHVHKFNDDLSVYSLHQTEKSDAAGTSANIQYRATGGSDDWARGAAGIK
jgi:hypothetical protein